ncbi:MAG: hypothetical protein HKN49_14335 [Gammaproteobacteria bacterium]|nr:hypothetical protein [Gammaproteobacteria bacterium]
MKNRFAFVFVSLVGVVTLLASSITEEDGTIDPPVAVTVNYTVTASTGVSREIDIRTDTLQTLTLSGSYSGFSGDGLTLDRASVTFAPSSEFDLSFTSKSADETLSGTTVIDVTDTIDFSLDTNPLSGQYVSDFDGTTTVVTIATDGVGIAVGSAAAVDYTWAEFDALGNDTSVADDIRAAALALDMLDALVRALYFAELVITDVEANRTVLEGSNLNTPVAIDCDNDATQGTGQASLSWTSDASGDDQGVIGRDDSFRGRYRNCYVSERLRFIEGDIDISDYIPDRGDGLRRLGATVDLSDLFVAEGEIDFNTPVAVDSPRLDGRFQLSYVENEVSVAAD